MSVFPTAKASAYKDTDVETGHGRVETRKCSVINDLTFLDGKKNWFDLKSIIRIESNWYNKTTYSLR